MHRRTAYFIYPCWYDVDKGDGYKKASSKLQAKKLATRMGWGVSISKRVRGFDKPRTFFRYSSMEQYKKIRLPMVPLAEWNEEVDKNSLMPCIVYWKKGNETDGWWYKGELLDKHVPNGEVVSFGDDLESLEYNLYDRYALVRACTRMLHI